LFEFEDGVDFVGGGEGGADVSFLVDESGEFVVG